MTRMRNKYITDNNLITRLPHLFVHEIHHSSNRNWRDALFTPTRFHLSLIVSPYVLVFISFKNKQFHSASYAWYFKRTQDVNARWCSACKTSSPFDIPERWQDSLGYSAVAGHDNNKRQFVFLDHLLTHNLLHSTSSDLDNSRITFSVQHPSHHIFQCLKILTWSKILQEFQWLHHSLTHIHVH